MYRCTPDLSKVSTDVTWGCCSEEFYVYWVETLPDERSAVVLVVLTERHLQPVLISTFNEEFDAAFYARVLRPPLFLISHSREIVDQFSVVARNYSVSQTVLTGIGYYHPASHAVGTRGKMPVGWSWPLPSSVDVNRNCNYTCTPPCRVQEKVHFV
jgi:hypothetical protein